MQQYRSIAVPTNGTQQASASTSAPATHAALKGQRELAKGWLIRLRNWAIGERDPIEQQMREVERQGRGMARLMHAAGYLMLILFSAGSAIGICGTLVQRVIANGPLTWQSLPNDIVITVSLMLVFCMDLAAIYAAFHMRLLATRRAPWTQYLLHAAVLLICTILEGGTFIQMSFAYDNVVAGTVALLIIARGVVAPLLSVYLNMARPIPVGVADLMYHSFVGSAQGLAHDMIHIANDPQSSLAEKAEMVSASAQVNTHEQAQLDQLIAVARRREGRETRNLPAALPTRSIVAASATLPETLPVEHHLPPNYTAMHGEASDYPITDEVSERDDEVDDEDWEDTDQGITAKFTIAELREEIAAATSGARKSGRSAVHSGPKGTTSGRDSRAEAISKGMKRSHKQRKEEAQQGRKRLIKELLFEILNSHEASGMPAKLTAAELADDVFALADGRLIVRPSEGTINILVEEWQQRNARAQRRAAAEQTMASLSGNGDDFGPMEPDELRELQEALA